MNNGEDPLMLLKRFIDDLFLIWIGPLQPLLAFLDEINNLHPTIKFTYAMTCPFTCDIPSDINHDCFCFSSKSIPFLDTLVTLKDGKIRTDLFRKETNRCQYLLPSSCHPSHICKNIPYSLCYRLVRICSERDALESRFKELKDFLMSRNYNAKIIDSATDRARLIPRREALKKVEKKPTNRTVFCLDFHPALPDINKMVLSGWRTMTKDPYLREVFEKPPMIAFRRPKSLRDLLVKAKVPPPPNRKSSRALNGMKKCNKCVVCPYVDECKYVYNAHDNTQIKINKPVSCETENVVYIVNCKKCNMKYVGETGRSFKTRMKEHRGYIRNKMLSEPTGEHFNRPGHDISHFSCTIIEKCDFFSKPFRVRREQVFIDLFHTKYSGMNRKL